MSTASKGELIRAGEGKTVPFGDYRPTVKVRAEDTENKYEIIEITRPPGSAVPLHFHQRTQQAYYVLEGELEFKLNEQTVRARAGDLVRVPTGVSHSFSNPTKVWAKALEVRAGGAESDLAEMDSVKMLEELSQAFPTGTPIERERVDMIMRRYDSIPAAPDATTRK